MGQVCFPGSKGGQKAVKRGRRWLGGDDPLRSFLLHGSCDRRGAKQGSESYFKPHFLYALTGCALCRGPDPAACDCALPGEKKGDNHESMPCLCGRGALRLVLGTRVRRGADQSAHGAMGVAVEGRDYVVT